MMSKSKEKKPLTKKQKKGIKIGVIIAVIAALLAGGIVFINHDNSKLYSKIVVAFMPKSMVCEDNGREIKFYIEENKDYNPEKDEPIAAWNVYYFDEVGNRTDLPDGHYQTTTANMQLTIGFLLEAEQNFHILGNVLSVILALIIIAVIGFLIYLWYKSWCRREDKKRELLKQAEKKLNKKNDL